MQYFFFLSDIEANFFFQLSTQIYIEKKYLMLYLQKKIYIHIAIAIVIAIAITYAICILHINSHEDQRSPSKFLINCMKIISQKYTIVNTV